MWRFGWAVSIRTHPTTFYQFNFHVSSCVMNHQTSAKGPKHTGAIKDSDDSNHIRDGWRLEHFLPFIHDSDWQTFPFPHAGGGASLPHRCQTHHSSFTQLTNESDAEPLSFHHHYRLRVRGVIIPPFRQQQQHSQLQTCKWQESSGNSADSHLAENTMPWPTRQE